MYNCIILNYHQIFDPENHGVSIDPRYSIPKETFEQHLEMFQKLNIKVISLDELINNPPEQNSVCLTFDDAFPSDYRIAFPLLQAHGYKGSFFIPVNKLSSPYQWDEYLELAHRGHTIGSHGVTHRYLTDLSTEEQKEELIASKYTIEEKLNQEVKYFAFPGGKYNYNLIQMAEEIGYKNLLTTNFGFHKNKIPFLVNRWNIKASTTQQHLQNVLTGNKTAIQFTERMNQLKQQVNSILGNELTDKLNYLNLS